MAKYSLSKIQSTLEVSLLILEILKNLKSKKSKVDPDASPLEAALADPSGITGMDQSDFDQVFAGAYRIVSHIDHSQVVPVSPEFDTLERPHFMNLSKFMEIE
jgi:hypothetical protein